LVPVLGQLTNSLGKLVQQFFTFSVGGSRESSMLLQCGA
jgi:hypothetical protein